MKESLDTCLDCCFQNQNFLIEILYAKKELNSTFDRNEANHVVVGVSAALEGIN